MAVSSLSDPQGTTSTRAGDPRTPHCHFVPLTPSPPRAVHVNCLQLTGGYPVPTNVKKYVSIHFTFYPVSEISCFTFSCLPSLPPVIFLQPSLHLLL